MLSFEEVLELKPLEVSLVEIYWFDILNKRSDLEDERFVYIFGLI